MKRRGSQERDEAAARAQAESRRETLLAELKAREVAARQPTDPASLDAAAEAAQEPVAPEPDAIPAEPDLPT